MKRYILMLICLLLLSGCQKQTVEENIDEKLYDQYQEYYQRLKTEKQFNDSMEECSISLVLNKTNHNNIRYDIIIDNPLHDMENIQAIAYVEKEEKYNPTSIGLLEEQTFSLKPGVIDKEKGIYKGINLSGMTTLKKFNVKLYMTFNYDDKLIERFIVLYGDAS